MSDEAPAPPEVEARVAALLRQLADEPPAGTPVKDDVLATVRWQSAVREATQLVGQIAAGAADAVSLLLGVRRRGGDRR